MTFTIAIIGRPNVGKSTLFNRFVGRRLAIVDNRPGVTRDRREADVAWGDLNFRLIDTAGLEDAPVESLEGRMQTQTEAAIADADLCFFLIDARVGVTPMDEHFADILHRGNRPILVLANKCEGKAAEAGLLDAHSLGLGDPIPLSAEHGEGMSDVYQAVLDEMSIWRDARTESTDRAEDDETGPMRIAIVGRPNAGKSTLVNRLLGQDRVLTGPEAGITRDAVSVQWQWNDRPIELVDTAGLRKKARIKDKLEKLSVGDALHAIKFAHVVILLLDAETSFEKQDLQIADLVAREGRALVIGVNKWDTVKNKQDLRAELEEKLDRLLPQIRGVPLVPISALRGQGLDRLIKSACEVFETWNRRIPTAKLNRWLRDAVDTHPAPADKGRRIRLRYMTQPNARPPSFVVFSQRAAALPESYNRYLINGLREVFNLWGVPIRLYIRAGDNPYAD